MNETRTPVPGCQGTNVRELLSQESLHVLYVEVEPGGEIPMHTHACAATMVVTQGQARGLGKGDRLVTKGDVIVKAANEPHGFTEVRKPFAFISISDGAGIRKADGWDMQYR